MKIHFYPFGDSYPLKFAVIYAGHEGKTVYCRHRDRTTWEFPGGHRGPGEDIRDTAARELREETGATRFTLAPVCVYSVTRDGSETFGALFRAEISEFGPLELEIEEIALGDSPPGEWTYPEIQPALLKAIECKGGSVMNKISLPGSNSYCPQPLFLYGTYREDGQPNYGLFCWCCYCAGDSLKFVACIGEDKLTRDRIRATGMFSATVVTQALLPDADWCGMHPGDKFDKSGKIPSEKGEALNVPVPLAGQWTLELKVDTTLEASPGSEIYICTIANVRADSRLADENLPFEEKLALLQPAVTLNGQYLPIEPRSLGAWGSF